MTDRVGRRLGRDEGGGPGGFGVVREAGSLGGLLDGEAPGRSGAASGAAESQGQLVGSGGAGWLRLRLVGELMWCHGVGVGG